MTVHAQLRAAYLTSGKSMADIGRQAGYSENTILRLLGPCPKNVSAETLIAVAMVLGLPQLSLDRNISR